MLVFCGEKRPKSMFGTQFSTPFSVATILWHGRSDLDVFGAEAFANPAILDLAARVEMIEDQELNNGFPQQIPARLKIVLKDGTLYEGKCDVPKGRAATRTPRRNRAQVLSVGAAALGRGVRPPDTAKLHDAGDAG